MPPRKPPCDHALDDGRCTKCHRTDKQIAQVKYAQSRAAEKSAIRRASKNGVNTLASQSAPDTGSSKTGPKVVDTRLGANKPRSSHASSDGSSNELDQSTGETTGGSSHGQSTSSESTEATGAPRRTGLADALRMAFGVEK